MLEKVNQVKNGGRVNEDDYWNGGVGTEIMVRDDEEYRLFTFIKAGSVPVVM